MKTSSDGIALIKKWEGLRLNAYLDSVGVPTIGYGHTGPDVMLGQSIDMDTADMLLRDDLERFEGYVKHYVKKPLKQNQFDALVSFTYNVGPGNLANSTLLKKVNTDPKSPDIPAEFLKWNRAGGMVLNGLTKRRQDEAELYAGSKKKIILLAVLTAAALLVLWVWSRK